MNMNNSNFGIPLNEERNQPVNDVFSTSENMNNLQAKAPSSWSNCAVCHWGKHVAPNKPRISCRYFYSMPYYTFENCLTVVFKTQPSFNTFRNFGNAGQYTWASAGAHNPIGRVELDIYSCDGYNSMECTSPKRIPKIVSAGFASG